MTKFKTLYDDETYNALKEIYLNVNNPEGNFPTDELQEMYDDSTCYITEPDHDDESDQGWSDWTDLDQTSIYQMMAKDANIEVKQQIIEKNFDILTKHEENTFKNLVREASTIELKSWVDLETMKLIPLSEARNIIDSRWLYKWKNKDGKKIVKARLVIRGFKDNQSETMETYSGTASRWSQRLICSIAATRRWTLLSADVSTAFLQGLTFEKMAELTGEPLRTVCIKMPPETADLLRTFPQFKSFDPYRQALKLIKPVYGLKDAPRAWRLMLDIVLTQLNGKKMIVDRQIYMWHGNERLTLLASTHVDDLKVTGDDEWINWLVKEIEQRVGKLTLQYAKDGFDHCGIHHKQQLDGTITMDQNAYVKTLRHIPVPKGIDPEAAADTSFQKAYMTLLGGLGWLTLTRYDISIFVSCLQRFNKNPKMKHVVNANRLLSWLVRHDLTCHYKPLKGNLRIVCISDSAFKKEDHEGLAMRGALICIVEDDNKSPGGILHIIEHYSRKQKRVVRSTFSAEINALVDAIEHGKLVMFAMTELCLGALTPKKLFDIEELGQWPMPLEAVVDAYSVYSTCVKLESKNPAEETLITLIMIIREGLRTGRISKLWWTDTRDMLADGLNKGAVSRDALRITAKVGKWILSHKCEGFTHAQALLIENKTS